MARGIEHDDELELRESEAIATAVRGMPDPFINEVFIERAGDFAGLVRLRAYRSGAVVYVIREHFDTVEDGVATCGRWTIETV